MLANNGRMFEALAHVRKELQCLWIGQLVDFFFMPVLALTPAAVESSSFKGRIFELILVDM